MRRLRRWMSNAMLAGSILLVLGTVALWVKSFSTEYEVTYGDDPNNSGFLVICSRGEIGVGKTSVSIAAGVVVS